MHAVGKQQALLPKVRMLLHSRSFCCYYIFEQMLIVMAFVSIGNFSFTEARGCGVGYITLAPLKSMLEVWLKHSSSACLPLLKSDEIVVLVRSPKSFQYRFAKLSILDKW